MATSALRDAPGLPGPSAPSREGRRRAALIVTVALLVLSNVMANRVLPSWAYVPWNLGMAALLLGVAWFGGRPPALIGLAPASWHRAVGVGLLVVAALALVFTAGVLIPGTRDAFHDTRSISGTTGEMLVQVLLKIPFGTVILEEIAFRGVLPGLIGTAPSVRWRWWPVLGASVLFGCWHILPSLGIATSNEAVADTLHGNQTVATVLTVVAMTAAGVLISAFARLGKGLATSMLLHWSSNSLAFTAAWLLVH